MFVSCHDMERLISRTAAAAAASVLYPTVTLSVRVRIRGQRGCCCCNVSVMMSSERECQFAVQTFVLQYVHTRTIIITKARCQPQLS